MGRAIPSTHFSTSELAASDQFDAWRDQISVIFDVARLGGAGSASFAARVSAYQIDNLVITDSIQEEQIYSISPKGRRAAKTDLFQIGFYRSGGYRGDADGLPITGGRGDVQVLDLAKSMSSMELASNMVCVFLPRELLQQRIGDLDDLHGIDLRTDGGSLLADYLDSLADELPRMEESKAEAAASETVDMIAMCLLPTTATNDQAKSSIRRVALLRAKRLIEDNLQSPHLNPEFLCRALRISRRTLYRMFEPLDGVHHYILRRRLSRIRRQLNDPDNRKRIADVAERCGFTRQETFWRAFKRRYGITPGEVRSLSSRRPDNVESLSGVGFDQWLEQMRG